jgi:DNA-binding transcriptional LysR family regulator
MEGVAGIGGRVSVGSVLTPATSLLPQAVKLLKERSPRTQVAVAVDTSRTMVEQLRAGELDIVIGRILDPSIAAELDFEPLADEPQSLIVRAGHPWLARADLTLADLAGAAWIMPAAGRVREQLMALFIGKGLEQPFDIIETVSLPLVPRLLADSDRIVPLARELVQPALDAGTLAVLPIDINLRADVYGIVTRKRHHLSPAAEAMLAALREAAGLTPR